MTRWMLFPMLAGVLALALSYKMTRAPNVTNDGTQYLDAAEHLRAGDCFCTTVAHFDEQIDHGGFPVPFTHFAPGYSILIAGLSFTRVSPVTAGYLISAVSFILALCMVWDMGLRLGVEPIAMLLVSLPWLANQTVLVLASAITADLEITAVLCVVVSLVVRDIQGKHSGRFLAVGIGVAAAAAYWIKYAGIFIIPVAVLYLLWRTWRNLQSRRWSLSGIAAALLVAAPIPIHNIVYEGSWRGGFQNSKHNGLRFAVVETIKAFYHLIFGVMVRAHLDIWAVIAIVSLISAVALAIRRRRGPEISTSLFWIFAFGAALTCGIAIAAMQSIAADLLRYNVPVYPLILVGAAVFFMPQSRAELAAFSLLTLAILVIESRSLLPSSASPAERMEMTLNQQVEPGVSMRQWLETHAPSNDVILAVNGQALHYVLNRPVVSVIEPIYSDRNTDEPAFRSSMSQFQAKYAVVFPGWGADLAPEQEAIPLLRELAAGTAPAWLRVAAQTPNVTVFERVDR